MNWSDEELSQPKKTDNASVFTSGFRFVSGYCGMAKVLTTPTSVSDLIQIRYEYKQRYCMTSINESIQGNPLYSEAF